MNANLLKAVAQQGTLLNLPAGYELLKDSAGVPLKDSEGNNILVLTT